MSVIGWLAAVWGGCAPLSLFFCARTRFLEPNAMLVFRVFAAIWVGPLVAVTALTTAAISVLASGLGAERTAAALAWWRTTRTDADTDWIP